MKRQAVVSGLALLLAGCARGAPIDAAVLAPPSPAAAVAAPTAPVRLPQDDAPHDNLTEWWYYTGHLDAGGGRTYGFELVIFQVERSTDPPAYAAHFAVTDNARDAYHFGERGETGKQVHAGPGLD